MFCFVFDVWWLDISFIWLESIKRAPGSWQQSNDEMREEVSSSALHSVSHLQYSNTKSFSLSWLLSKPCTYSSSSHLSSIILPFSYHCFFLPSKPFSFPLPLALLPSSFLQCLLCASLPPSASFSLSPFLQNTAGHVDEHMEQPLRGRAQCQYADDPCSAQHKHVTPHNNESHLAFFNS